jgi:MFS family permease
MAPIAICPPYVWHQVQFLGQWFTITFLWAIFNLPITILSFYGGILGDKFGRKPVIVASRFLLFTVPLAYLLGLMTGDWFWLLVSGFLGGIAMGGAEINVNALSIDMADHEDPLLKSTYSSLLMFVLGVTAFVGAIIFGALADLLISFGIEELATYIILLGVITIFRFVAWFSHFWLLVPPVKKNMGIDYN